MKKGKLVLAVILVLVGFASIFKGSFIVGLLLMIFGVILYQKVSDKISETFPVWKNKFLRYGVYFGLMVLTGAQIGKKDKETLEASPEFIAENFSKENPNNQLIKIADTLLKLDDYFDSEDSKKYFYEKNYKSTSDGKVLYQFLDVQKDSLFKDYQNLQNGKYLIDYSLEFGIKDKKVNNVTAFVTYNDGSKKEFTESNVFTISSLLNTTEIKKMKVALSKLAEAQKIFKEQEERRANFEKECFSSLNGYNLALVNAVKENLHDEDSFEHVETKFKLMDDYAVVIMKYRAKNGFNALILSQVTAKINYDCQVIEIVE